LLGFVSRSRGRCCRGLAAPQLPVATSWLFSRAGLPTRRRRAARGTPCGRSRPPAGRPLAGGANRTCCQRRGVALGGQVQPGQVRQQPLPGCRPGRGGRAGRPGAWSSRSSASSPPAVSSCRAAASSVAAPRCCGSLTSVWVWGGEAAKDRLCRRRRWRMQGSSGCCGGAVRDADAVTRGLTLDAADDEDVPSLVELGWRSELYPTRRLRQFR